MRLARMQTTLHESSKNWATAASFNSVSMSRPTAALSAALCTAGAIVIFVILALGQAPQDSWLAVYREPAQRIMHAAQADDFAWQRLADLTDTFGHRLSGSAALEEAIRWAAEQMRKDGLEDVRLDPVL